MAEIDDLFISLVLTVAAGLMLAFAPGICAGRLR